MCDCAIKYVTVARSSKWNEILEVLPVHSQTSKIEHFAIIVNGF